MSKVDHIGDLKADPENARQHTPRNIGMITDSLRKVGAARSIVIDENDIILAGNGVVDAAAEAGIERVRVIEADGNEIIAVRRTGLTPEQKKTLAYYDNRTGELAFWNASQIAADLEAGLVLDDMFFAEEQAAILERAATDMGAPNLDDLADQYEPVDERQLWPVIRVQVSPETETKYKQFMDQAPGQDEAAKFAAIVDAALSSTIIS